MFGILIFEDSYIVEVTAESAKTSDKSLQLVDGFTIWFYLKFFDSSQYQKHFV